MLKNFQVIVNSPKSELFIYSTNIVCQLLGGVVKNKMDVVAVQTEREREM